MLLRCSVYSLSKLSGILFLIVGSSLFAETGGVTDDTTVVARVLTQDVSLSELAPPATMLAEKRTLLDTQGLDKWLLEYRADSLLSIVEMKLYNAYAKTNGLEATEEDVRSYAATKSQTSLELVAILKAKTETIRSELSRSNISDNVRADLLKRLKAIESYPLDQVGDRKVNDDGQTEKIRKLLLYRNVNRAIYREYGGRVLLSSLGYHIAIDARRQFLADQARRANVQVYDDELQKAMWRQIEREEGGQIVEGQSAVDALR